MSHFTKVTTKIKNIAMLQRALETLGVRYTVAEEGQTLDIKGWQDEQVKAVMEIDSGCSYGIGVVENQEGGLELVADWWAIETWTERTQQEIVSEITRQYAYETVMDKLKAGGYSVVTEEQDEKNEVHVVMRKWS